MESIRLSTRNFSYAQSSGAAASDSIETLIALRREKRLTKFDFDRLVYGDLNKYAPVVANTIAHLAFLGDLPELVDEYSEDLIRLACQEGLHAAGNAVSGEVIAHSPFRTTNLPTASLYDLLYKALCGTGPVHWHDEQTQRLVTELARIVRGAFSHAHASYPSARTMNDLPGGAQQFHLIQHAYAELGNYLGIPFEKYPHLGLRFCIEKNVIDAAQREFGVDPDNPLLVFMFDKEKNYAEGMAQGWLAALQLVARLKSDGAGSLTVKDLETLHKACAQNVESTLGCGVSSEMGASSVSYAITETHGLTKQGKKERNTFYDWINNESIALTQNSTHPFREQSHQLCILGVISIGGVYMCRKSLFKKQEDNISHVRQLAESLIERFRIMLEQASNESDDAARRHTERVAVVSLCQCLERLHPFEDANGRVFEFLLPNVLLLTLGHEAYAPCDPYLFDGAAIAEVEEEICQGQAEVRKIRDACASPNKAEPRLASPEARPDWTSKFQ